MSLSCAQSRHCFSDMFLFSLHKISSDFLWHKIVMTLIHLINTALSSESTIIKIIKSYFLTFMLPWSDAWQWRRMSSTCVCFMGTFYFLIYSSETLTFKFPAHWWRRTLFVPYEGGVEWEVSYAGRNSRVSGWYSVPARAICTVGAAFFFKQSARALHLFANSLTLLTQRACVHVCVLSLQ